MLLLCRKHIHSSFTRDTYNQLDGVTMGSSLGSFLANVLMCSLEEAIVPTLRNCLVSWKSYVNDTHAYINPDKTDCVKRKLNSYHKLIQIFCKLEKQFTSFLEVSLWRLDNERFQTIVFGNKRKIPYKLELSCCFSVEKWNIKNVGQKVNSYML